MAKTKEELTKLKEEYEQLTEKLEKLTEKELKQVVGGSNDVIAGAGDNPDITSPSNPEALKTFEEEMQRTAPTPDYQSREKDKDLIDKFRIEVTAPEIIVYKRR